MTEPVLDNPGPHNFDTGGSIFLGASGVNIHGGTFTAYGSDGTEIRKKKIADAMELLDSRAEDGAPYDAAAREDVPKCHEETRVAIIDGIDKWAGSQLPDARPLMWMYGPAGSGKTTIMQTVAGTFDQEGRLAASFFFSRLSAGRPKKKQNFVITLARQLALNIPAMQEPLAEALSDKSIFTKSLEKQLDALIIGPFNSLDHTQIGSRRVFLVDGLDECEGDSAQQDILDLLNRLGQRARHRVRILVASRTLSHIQTFFSRRTVGELTQSTPLDNNYQSDEDVKNFLISAFRQVRDEHPSCGDLSLEWPCHSDINVLVRRASGQFIYASTIVKFIADHGRHPDQSLQTILDIKASSNAKPYEELDAVYAQVLSSIEPENLEFVRTLFGCLFLDSRDFYIAYVAQRTNTVLELLDFIFMTKQGTTKARINRVSPLLQPFTPTTSSSSTNPTGIRFAHASFDQYLRDHFRSNKYFVDLRRVHCTLAQHWLHILPIQPSKNPEYSAYRDSYNEYYLPHWHEKVSEYAYFGELCDLVFHCFAAEWTSELRQDILTFNIEAVLTANPTTSAQAQHLQWDGLIYWLCFLFCIKKSHLLPSAEIDGIFNRIHALIQSVLSELSIPHTLVRVFATALTMHKHISISGALFDANYDIGQSCEWVNFRTLWAPQKVKFGSYLDVYNSAHLWLYKSLLGDTPMEGSFFADRHLYTEFALVYAQFQDMEKEGGTNRKWINDLPVILSKAAPSEELATLLVQKFLQPPRKCFIGLSGSKKSHFFTAVCIYLFECGVPFLSKHEHREYYDPYDFVCGICFLFDPLKPCMDIEISQEPIPQPPINPMPVAEVVIHEPLQVNLHHQGIPGLLVFWLQAWIVWLADAVVKFFPVVA